MQDFASLKEDEMEDEDNQEASMSVEYVEDGVADHL